MKNRRLKKIVLITACIAVAGGLVSAVWAGHRHHDRHEHYDRPDRHENAAEYIADKLSLSDAQEEQLKDMLEDTAERREKMRDAAEEKIESLLTQDKISKKDALRIMQLRQTQKEKMRDHIASQLVVFHAFLTPKQREELAELAPRMRQYLRGGKGRGNHGGRKRKYDAHRYMWQMMTDMEGRHNDRRGVNYWRH